MFGPQSNATDEALFDLLRHHAKSTSYKGMDNIQAELWRRGVTQEQYISWLKAKKEKEKDNA